MQQRVLLTGANGFIGSHIARALTAAGHTVVPATRQSAMAVDFTRDVRIEDWIARLNGIDVVINAVGILRNSRHQPMRAIHTDTPIALFEAAARCGIKKVVQISALGVHQGNTPYALSKRAADEALMRLSNQRSLSAHILRPSVVLGRGGASTAMFVNLAKLPVLLLPQPLARARVQPVSVLDLADAVVRLMSDPIMPNALSPTPIEIVGPNALRMVDLIASLRQQMGKPAARALFPPEIVTQLSARMGDVFIASPWCTQSLELLAIDNTGDARVLQEILGREARAVQTLLPHL